MEKKFWLEKFFVRNFFLVSQKKNGKKISKKILHLNLQFRQELFVFLNEIVSLFELKVFLFSALKWRAFSFGSPSKVITIFLFLFLFCFHWHFLIPCQKYPLQHIIWFRNKSSIYSVKIIEDQYFFKKDLFHFSFFSYISFSLEVSK